MNIPLDDFFDTHFVHVDRCNETTLNIIIRARINRTIESYNVAEALKLLNEKHNYLSAKVVEKTSSDKSIHYKLHPVEQNSFYYDVLEVNPGSLDAIMNSLSEYRYHRFKLNEGPLVHLQVWHDNSNSIIEFSCAHLLGDITAALIITNDILDLINASIDKRIPTLTACERIVFSIDKLKGREAKHEPLILSSDDLPDSNYEKWPQPDYTYERHSISLERFKHVDGVLENKGIKAKTIDLFYYFAFYIYYNNFGTELDLSVIFSFRKHLKYDKHKNCINTFAIFAPLIFPSSNIENIKVCLEEIYRQRKSAIKIAGVNNALNFIHSLNNLVAGKDIKASRNIINSLIQMGSVFCFNNLGSVDYYFRDRSNFNVIDIDIQDGVPTDETRMFGFRNNVHINPMLQSNGSISAARFWEEFLNRLEDFERS